MLAIDFGARSIKAVQLSRTGKGFRIDNFGIVLTPPDSIMHGEIKDSDLVTQALEKMLRKKGIREKKGIIAITGQKVIVREITTPIMNEKELIEGLQWEAPKYVPYDLKESLLDAKKIEELEEKEGSQMMKVLLVAAPKSIVDQQITVLKNVRIQPKVVDIVSNAQMRAFDSYLLPAPSNEEDGTKMDVIISMGASTTEITLIEGDRLKFTRTILKGGDDINRLLVKELEITFDEAERLKRRVGLTPVKLQENKDNEQEASPEHEHEEKNMKNTEEEDEIPNKEQVTKLIRIGVNDIFNEIRKSLNYYKTQYQKVAYQRIILTGGMAAMSNIGQALKQQFGITIVMANPLKGIDINQGDVNIDNLERYKRSLATAIGLAKRER
ncbi:MAG: type IV pilus assembly protein PilM [Candidatus Caldatribacteriota bacterium]|jgi:type IV pilus assembly protein PilM|nr:type IV pilus assembly protein PilM [Atribacterota bacterium]MDD4289501.1 type IV pilus assembly protein PilM [Atribacterota bacterium]MDI9596123.1 type IV pilus assembly protein PilM [Atribacterota bacterium]